MHRIARHKLPMLPLFHQLVENPFHENRKFHLSFCNMYSYIFLLDFSSENVYPPMLSGFFFANFQKLFV